MRKTYLAGSPYHLEDVLGVNLNDRAKRGKLTFLLLNQPPVCDSHCRRCFMPAARRNRREGGLTTEEYQRVITEAANCGMFCLEISGEGEPLMSPSLESIIQTAHGHGFITTLITNGHLLREEFVRFAFEHRVTLVVSLFSTEAECYEVDNSLPGSFRRTMENIQMAAAIYQEGILHPLEGVTVYRMAVHTTAQSDNLNQLVDIRTFCHNLDIFFSVAPLAPVGGGSDHPEMLLDDTLAADVSDLGDNSIILSRTAKEGVVGREVCGTCLYGLNVGFDGNMLFDAHAGYEIGDRLGNVRTDSVANLVNRQLATLPNMFGSINGFCPPRDPRWQEFLLEYMGRV